MIIFLTETYACQTCFIPITNYFRAITRRWLTFSTPLARNQYISQHAPLIRPLSKLAAKQRMQRNAECQIGMFATKHENLSTVSKKQFAFTLARQKSSMLQATCIKSVRKAMGSPKDQITYCSIPSAADLLPAYVEMTEFSSGCTKAYLYMQQPSIENSSHSQENRTISHRIEPLRSFEPYTRVCFQFAILSPNSSFFEQRIAAYTQFVCLVAQKIKTFWSRQ